MREMWSGRRPIRAGLCPVLFFCGMLAGILAAQSWKDAGLSGVFSEYFLNQYASLKIDSQRLFRYVGGYRTGQYLMLVCCAALPAAPVLLGGLLFGLGALWGTTLSVSILRLGVKGMILCVAGLLPQLFFYLPAFGWSFLWMLRQGSSRKKYLFLTAAGFFFLFFGIASETYLNPMILQQILRKM
ncbi:MAG: hypothetical protein Q4C82_06455 [Eubacteriales bacterium]|nr:hypothetical protein [Eubacteriales bacterium]